MKLPARLLAGLGIALFVAACAQFVAGTSGDYHEVAYQGSATDGVVLLSGNINGETQPCGCRKFPLGGLEQAAGHFHEQRSKGPVLYVDTGDLLFPTPIIPENLKDSHRFTADTLVEAMEQFGLNYFVPGDQDFALGLEYLEKISQRAKFTFLMANLNPGTQFKSRPWARVRMGEKKLLLIGVVDPELLSPEYAGKFSDPAAAIERSLREASPSKTELVILLSHSGMDKDRSYAAKFPRLNWVMGAHSQSYTVRPVDEGSTQLVQVLSRNHFIGRLQFGLGDLDEQTSFALLETREEMAKAVEPNPLTPLMGLWRAGLAKVQEEEQRRSTGALAPDPLPTFNSCVDCHRPQVAFWQSTSHALAWQTLVAKGTANDPSCVGCHSLGWQHPQGFTTTPQRVRFAGATDEAKLQAYSSALAKVLQGVKTPRTMTAKARRERAALWMKQIEDHGVTHEYGNVQCVNCHDKNRDHPFNGASRESQAQMVSKCLTCHTADQSPEWYQKDARGLPGKPADKVIATKLSAVSCPVK